MGAIAASWVISPLLGGAIAAAFLAFIKFAIIYRDDKIAAARKWVPVLIAIMAGVFATYLAMKGLKKIVKIDMATLGRMSAGWAAAGAHGVPQLWLGSVGLTGAPALPARARLRTALPLPSPEWGGHGGPLPRLHMFDL